MCLIHLSNPAPLGGNSSDYESEDEIEVGVEPVVELEEEVEEEVEVEKTEPAADERMIVAGDGSKMFFKKKKG